MLCEAEQRPDDRLDPVQAPVGSAQDPAERLLEALDQGVDAGIEEVLFGRKVVEERLFADSRRLGDGLEGRAVVAPVAKSSEGLSYQLLPAPLPGKAAHRRLVTGEAAARGVGGAPRTSPVPDGADQDEAPAGTTVNPKFRANRPPGVRLPSHSHRRT